MYFKIFRSYNQVCEVHLSIDNRFVNQWVTFVSKWILMNSFDQSISSEIKLKRVIAIYKLSLFI